MTLQKEIVNDTKYINTLRVCATFAVIMIHIFAPINSYFSYSLTKMESYICIILNYVWQWCVPIFVMITGVLFLNPEKKITWNLILKKYILRIIIAIILFGIPYCFMEILFDANISFNVSQIGIAALNVLQGKTWAHMWYLYMICGLYLCIPIIKIFVSNASTSTVKYTLVLLFIFTSIIPSLEDIIPYKFGIYIPINSVYVFYLLLGYYIHYNNIKINNCILWLLLTVYVLFNPLVLALNGNLLLTGYNSPIVVMVSFSIFCILRQKSKVNKIMEITAPMCFGIYLIHPLFINFLYKFVKLTPEKYSLLLVIVTSILTAVLSSIIFSYIARKIKIVKKYVL